MLKKRQNLLSLSLSSRIQALFASWVFSRPLPLQSDSTSVWVGGVGRQGRSLSRHKCRESNECSERKL